MLIIILEENLELESLPVITRGKPHYQTPRTSCCSSEYSCSGCMKMNIGPNGKITGACGHVFGFLESPYTYLGNK